jgi:Protein of unknown function (DUF3562)
VVRQITDRRAADEPAPTRGTRRLGEGRATVRLSVFRERGQVTVDGDDVKLRKQLESAALSLSEEFAGRVPSEDVDRYFAEELQPFNEARVWDFVPIFAERRTRSRLRSIDQAR